MATTNNEQIFVQINGERIELTGKALEDFLVDRAQRQAEAVLLQAEQDAKATAKESALAKFAALGLTEEELATLSV
jgi:hypothetical protein